MNFNKLASIGITGLLALQLITGIAKPGEANSGRPEIRNCDLETMYDVQNAIYDQVQTQLKTKQYYDARDSLVVLIAYSRAMNSCLSKYNTTLHLQNLEYINAAQDLLNSVNSVTRR